MPLTLIRTGVFIVVSKSIECCIWIQHPCRLELKMFSLCKLSIHIIAQGRPEKYNKSETGHFFGHGGHTHIPIEAIHTYRHTILIKSLSLPNDWQETLIYYEKNNFNIIQFAIVNLRAKQRQNRKLSKGISTSYMQLYVWNVSIQPYDSEKLPQVGHILCVIKSKEERYLNWFLVCICKFCIALCPERHRRVIWN